MKKILQHRSALILVFVLSLLLASCGVDPSTITGSGSGGSSSSDSRRIPYPEVPPPYPVQTTPGVGTVTLTWDKVPGATSYNIYWSNSPDDGTSGTKITNVTSPYTHEGLTPGLEYYYVMTSKNGSGESVPSGVVSGTPAAELPAPSNVQATPGIGTITLTWDDVPGATSYNIYWSYTSGDGIAGTKITNVTSPYVHEDLNASNDYYYVVTAEDTYGQSAPSDEVSGTPATGLPAPANVQATPGPGIITLTWDAVPGATSYNVYWSNTSGDGTSGTKITNVASPYVHKALVYGSNYYYVVTAENVEGEGVPSDEASATPGRVLISDIVFADSNFKFCIDSYNKTYADEITAISCANRGITSISGIEWFTSVWGVSLQYNYIKKLGPMASLVKVTNLNLMSNSVSNVSPLANLTKMQYLSLNQNNISDISALAGMTEMKSLDLNSYNSVSDISALAGMTQMYFLNLSGNNVSDLGPLAGLSSLKTLYLGGNAVVDLSPLAGLTGLTFLNLSSNNITYVSALSNLIHLTYLNLYWNTNIADISPLSGLTSLNTLYLGRNNITDIGPLSSLTNLTNLDLMANHVADISPLTSLTKLTNLTVYQNNVTNISPLSEMTQLIHLSLGGNTIADFSPLLDLTNVIQLNLMYTGIVDVSLLSNLTGLIDLQLGFNPITTGVADLVTLTNATKIAFGNDTSIPCADLTTLVNALGPGVVFEPLSCVQ